MKKTLSKSRSKSKSKSMSKHKKRHMPKHKKSKSKSMSKHRKKQMSKSLTKYNKRYRKKMTKKRTKKGEKKRKKKRGGMSGLETAGLIGLGVVGTGVAGAGLYKAYRYMSKGNDNGDKGDDVREYSQPSSRPIKSKSNNYEFIVNEEDDITDDLNADFKAIEGILCYADDNTIVINKITYSDLQNIIQLYMDNKKYKRISIKIPYGRGTTKFEDMSEFVDFVGDRSASADDQYGQFVAKVPFGTISIDYS